jgi:AcrR family transcriptional regulator
MANTSTAKQDRPRRGRPRAGERAEREARIVAAAVDELVERGYDGVTMLAIATRAGASKETLYNWFGSKEGLFAAVITANADESAARIAAALDTDDDPRETLVGYAIGLLTLLTGPASVALNRAAMSSPELAEVLLAQGRHRVGPLVEEYLARVAETGLLEIDDPAEAFELLYGLVVRDTQIRTLLGTPPPSPADIRRRAESAVDDLVRLLAP